MMVGMPATRHLFLGIAAIAALGLALAGGPSMSTAPLAPGGLRADVRAEPMRFAAGVAPGDRQVVEGAIAASIPGARALIDEVDGLVTIQVGPTGIAAVGLTEGNADKGYTVTLDLATVSQALGDRGIKRLVLHELGHVVDHALLTPEEQRALDAGIPQGYACNPGEPTGACATREERFAETFAKWATGDIGINVSLGYKVPPPPSLDAWATGLPASG
jgi:hypothetical protein